MMNLRPYQQKMVGAIHNAWNIGYRNVCAVASTGAGKSVVISDIVRNHQGVCVIIAHRQELVSQMSMHLCREGIRHNIVSSVPVIKMITKMQQAEYGKIFYHSNAAVAVAGVDTIIRRGEQLRTFLPKVTLWIIDECHHLLKSNKWGKAVELFTHKQVCGLGVTATPMRLDGQGLSNDTDGYFETIVESPPMLSLINDGYLTQYKIYAPISNIALDNCKISQTTGDYTQNSINNEIAKSSLVVHEKSTQVGDVVSEYIRIAKNKLAIVFVPSMNIGYELEQQFIDMGITAKVINAKTPDNERAESIKAFARREIMVLLNVDIFGEGFDLPALEVVQMARPTQSYGMYSQMFGRVLRLMKNKTHGIVIDHVGNVARHGLPDAQKNWTLDRRKKSNKIDIVQIKTCPECSYVYDRFLRACPDCGYTPVIKDRSDIVEVDGELSELSEEMLAVLRGSVNNFDRPVHEQVEEYSQQLNEFIKPIHKLHHQKVFASKIEYNQKLQKNLRTAMAYYGGKLRAEGLSNNDIHRRFYIEYEVDWLSAMTLQGDVCINLTNRVEYEIRK